MSLTELNDFEARQSEDQVKTDLELTCTKCDTIVCDIEPGDELGTLVSVVADHECSPFAVIKTLDVWVQ